MGVVDVTSRTQPGTKNTESTNGGKDSLAGISFYIEVNEGMIVVDSTYGKWLGDIGASIYITYSDFRII